MGLGLELLDLIIMITGTVFLAVFLIIFFLSLKYKDLFEVLEEEDFPFKELYCVGYYVMDKIGYEYKSRSDRKMRKNLEVLYGEQYVDYYLRVIYAQKVTVFMVLFELGFILYGFTYDITVCIGVWFLSGIIFYYFGSLPGKKIQERTDEMMSDFTNVVSKLALFINAGMIMKEAWEEVANAENTLIYREMRTSVEEMKNGRSETEALYSFGMRCMVPEIKKFTSTIIQGIEKGNNELSYMLQHQSKEVWNIKRQNVKRAGELAAGKLMIPMFIMLIGVLILVVVPIFANIGI